MRAIARTPGMQQAEQDLAQTAAQTLQSGWNSWMRGSSVDWVEARISLERAIQNRLRNYLPSRPMVLIQLQAPTGALNGAASNGASSNGAPNRAVAAMPMPALPPQAVLPPRVVLPPTLPPALPLEYSNPEPPAPVEGRIRRRRTEVAPSQTR